MGGQALPLLAIQRAEYCTLLLGQSGVHSIATPNLVAGRSGDKSTQVAQRNQAIVRAAHPRLDWFPNHLQNEHQRTNLARSSGHHDDRT
jgi:hypothetical protein